MDTVQWLNQRQDILQNNSGKWIAIDIEHDKVFASEDLRKAISDYQKEHPNKEPAVFKVPRNDEEFILL